MSLDKIIIRFKREHPSVGAMYWPKGQYERLQQFARANALSCDEEGFAYMGIKHFLKK